MRINPVNFINYSHKALTNKVNFKSNVMSADDVTLLTKMSRGALTEADNLIEETIKIKKQILTEVNQFKKETKQAKKNNFENEYYPHGIAKRVYINKITLFTENIGAIDYTPYGRSYRSISIHNGKPVSLEKFLSNDITNEYEFNSDGTFSTVTLGKTMKKTPEGEYGVYFDKKFIFDERGILKRAEISGVETENQIKVKNVYDFNRYLELINFSVDLSTDRQLNIDSYKYVFTYDDKKPKMLEIDVEEPKDSLKRTNLDKREVGRTIQYLN